MNGVQKKSHKAGGEGLIATQYSNIENADRRITKYVMTQVYVWLTERILKGEYHANRSREARELLTIVRQKREITAQQYSRFLELFYNEPFEYIFLRKQLKNSAYITTENVENYFIDYNGAKIPVGFVKDFFEDDYETQKEIEDYMAEYVKKEVIRTKDNCAITSLKNQNKIEDLEDKYPNVFRTSKVFYVTRFLCLAVFVLVASLFFRFAADTHMWDVVVMGTINGTPTISVGGDEVEGYTYIIEPKYCVWNDGYLYLDARGDVHTAEEVADPYSFINSPYFTPETYWSTLGLSLVINCVLALYVLINGIRTIRELIFHIKLFIIHRRVAEQKRLCMNYGSVTEAIEEYGKEPEVVFAMCKGQRQINDDICRAVSAPIKRFYKRPDNSPVLQKIAESIDKLALGAKKLKYLKFFYDMEDIRQAKKVKSSWIGYVVKIVILCAIVFIINWPVDAVLSPVVDILVEFFG